MPYRDTLLAGMTVLLLAVHGAAPAHADDAEMIATCLQTERDAGRDVHSCIGHIADPCLDDPAGQSTVGMVQCMDKETKLWDTMLNEEYTRLLSIITGAAAESVRKAERAWIATRDADCQVAYDIFQGGTIAQPISARCRLDHTADRALQVRSWREMAQPE
jgi:uncharacterized protein YecT (DUF1311 family)